MSATYTANLVAYLTVTIEVKPIDTLKDLAESPDVYPIIFPGHVLNDLFRVSCLYVYVTRPTTFFFKKMDNLRESKSNRCNLHVSNVKVLSCLY